MCVLYPTINAIKSCKLKKKKNEEKEISLLSRHAYQNFFTFISD